MNPRTPRSLRFRFFAALSGLLIGAITALAAISIWLIFPALQEEERATIKRELDRVERSFQLDQQQLHAQVRDWAHWDDTYQFVQGNYPRYADVNFSQEMFENMRYQLMAFFTRNGDVHFLAGINPATGSYQTCHTPADICSWMAPWVNSMQAAIKENRTDQTNIYPDNPLAAVASSPILLTDKSGISPGWLFKTRTLNNEWLRFLEDYTGLSINLSVSNQAAPLNDTFSFSGNTVVAERYLPISGSTAPASLAVGVELDRTSYLTSLATFRYVLLWTAGLMIAVIVIVLLLLEKIVLKPLRLLTQFTQQVGTQEINHDKLTNRNDEIGLLARTFEQQFTRQRQLNEKLSILSTHDPLTGLPNRRLFDQELQRAVEQAIAHHTPVAVMMLDIDHFKLFNDHYGHPKGDHCLATVGATLQAFAENNDVLIARTGGEEFSVLAEMPADQAHRLANAINAEIDALNYPHNFSPVAPHLTFSIGISALEINEHFTPTALMSTADQALYEAKKAGRHQVRLYAPPLVKETISTHNTPP
ncbi:sensor domain-containing diguanylate cyclase [Halomonas sp. GFAJ-1]|uniref:sensor domain-containing diguanylate cyclase n=1 Tax=Halomonas sp. GFAJ-1 TaxID=1118153 RepID=UPI00023A4677|nr:diguanylate cyclase [Halomonas sp. GFAJ-1]AVI63369.1 response regulator [Halomonas sp. GFAJ-1]EHK62534.1 diguanylate cyclase [Halomonas sp. GFAJ-1]